MGLWWDNPDAYYEINGMKINKDCPSTEFCAHSTVSGSMVSTISGKTIALMFYNSWKEIPEHFKQFAPSSDTYRFPKQRESKWWEVPELYYECGKLKISKMCIETYPCFHKIWDNGIIYELQATSIKELYIKNNLKVHSHFDDDYFSIFDDDTKTNSNNLKNDQNKCDDKCSAKSNNSNTNIPDSDINKPKINEQQIFDKIIYSDVEHSPLSTLENITAVKKRISEILEETKNLLRVVEESKDIIDNIKTIDNKIDDDKELVLCRFDFKLEHILCVALLVLFVQLINHIF
jgi:hypothetical protein